SNDTPRADQNRTGHHQPQEQADNSHLDDDIAEPALDAACRRRHMQDSRDVLSTKRHHADSITVWPARVRERGHEIGQWIVAGAMNDFAGWEPRIERFGIDCEAVQQRLRISYEKSRNRKDHTERGT